MKIYLASGSPRRRELLAQIGIEYEVKVSEADENSDITAPDKLVEELSRRKALAVLDEIVGELSPDVSPRISEPEEAKDEGCVREATESKDKKCVSEATEAKDKKFVSEPAENIAGFAVIGADTVVSIDGQVLGKPRSEDDAVNMLKRLSGRTHEVYTGVTVIVVDSDRVRAMASDECAKSKSFGECIQAKSISECIQAKSFTECIRAKSFGECIQAKSFTECIRVKSFSECTKVSFYEMSEAEIREYVATRDPLDKAGSYGIQGFCARYIEKIDGDYNNVVGLPIGRLYQEMKDYL